MTSQNLNQNKNPYLDKLLDWYDKSKLQDQNDIKLHKENFIKSLKDINKEEIKNTIQHLLIIPSITEALKIITQ